MDVPVTEMRQSVSCSMKIGAEAGENSCCAHTDPAR